MSLLDIFHSIYLPGLPCDMIFWNQKYCPDQRTNEERNGQAVPESVRACWL